MTKYILAGGNERHIDGYGQRLSDEIHRTVQNPKVLSCFFAEPEANWPAVYDSWSAWFLRYIPDIASYELAHVDSFNEQVKSCDVVYLHGGDTRGLIEKLREAGVDRETFTNKVVVGSSAGANCLAQNYWSSSRASHSVGLGILDVNVMVHYGAEDLKGRIRTQQDWEREEADFQAIIGPDRQITHLPEGQFITIE